MLSQQGSKPRGTTSTPVESGGIKAYSKGLSQDTPTDHSKFQFIDACVCLRSQPAQLPGQAPHKQQIAGCS
jgi:hypothetical protein